MKKFQPGVADFGEAEEVPARFSSMVPAEEHRDRRREIVSRAVIKDLRTAEEFANEIGSLWNQAHERFIDIGRYLLMAKERLVEHGGFMKLVRTRLPFSQPVANKLMAVARAIEQGEFPLGALPRSYANAYEIVSLGANERVCALEAGIVRPDVQRAEILAFKRRLRQNKQSAAAEEEAFLQRRLIELERRRQMLDEEIAGIRQRLGAIPERPSPS
jgi:hypothetical protein